MDNRDAVRVRQDRVAECERSHQRLPRPSRRGVSFRVARSRTLGPSRSGFTDRSDRAGRSGLWAVNPSRLIRVRRCVGEVKRKRVPRRRVSKYTRLNCEDQGHSSDLGRTQILPI
jgi:hypothetical protein